ncbi:unnamed protein product [Ambrosiozyma monospora]|uniref:Unnamed protein product n=1 Tax=Ambrosiozyma monospora TaxID=43982 RepID=A0ACB5TS39_AMBMO|nr:unnamed protein product [Ambrosiozyma monospora]
MFEQNNKLSSEHPYASEPQSWPLTLSGVSFWTKSESREQIYFIGNIFGWWLEVLLIIAYCAVVLADVLTRRRQIYLLTDKARARLYHNISFFFCGWVTHYFPFFLMSRQKFLHHYLPAHLLAALFSASFLEFLFTDNRTPDTSDPKKKDTSGKLYTFAYLSVIVALLSALIWCFVFFAPLTYGNVSLNIEEILKRQWFDIKLHFAK